MVSFFYCGLGARLGGGGSVQCQIFPLTRNKGTYLEKGASSKRHRDFDKYFVRQTEGPVELVLLLFDGGGGEGGGKKQNG